MRHRLDLVDLQNPKIRRPAVRLEYRIVVGTEISGYALPVEASLKLVQKGGLVMVHLALIRADQEEARRASQGDRNYPEQKEIYP